MGAVTGKAWTDYSEPRIMAADLEAIEAAIAEAAASTIVGVGRPDIPATLTTPGTAALVAAATSGTVFRSLDGPQGAWEWQKRGTAWAVTQGDTGWRDIRALVDPEEWEFPAAIHQFTIRRTAPGTVEFKVRGDSINGNALLLSSPPPGFRAAEYVALGAGILLPGSAPSIIHSNSSSGELRVGPTPTTGQSLSARGMYASTQVWPSTLPGTPA